MRWLWGWGLPAGVAVALALGVILTRQVFWEGGRPVRVILVDDAMISMSFARSLAEGCGLVWYCGYPRVQGYTNLGWTLYMALWHEVGLPPEYTSVPILLTGLVLLMGYVHGLYRLGGVLWGREVGLWAAWIGALFPPVIFHFSKGLEAGLLAMLVGYFVLELVEGRRVWVLGLIAVVGTLVRLDFGLWVGAVLVGDRVRRGGVFRRGGWGEGLVLGALVVGVAVGVLVWQRGYYGSWLPNTYHLKVSSVPTGMRWLNGVLATAMHVGINLPLYGIAIWGLWRGRLWREAFPLLAALGASVFYNIHVGGDIYEDSASSNRFLLNGFIGPFLLAGWALSRAPKGWQAGIGLALISYGLPLSPNFAYRWRMLWRHDERVFYMPMVVQHFAEGDTLYIGPAGTMPYFFRRYVWRDFLGKVDPFTVRKGLLVMCNGRPPLLYFTGHTRLYLEGLFLKQTRGWLASYIPKSLCEGRAGEAFQHSDVYWWSRYIEAFDPCSIIRRSRPAWYPFPSDSLRRCFCEQFEPLPWYQHSSWKRRRPPGTCPQ